MVAGLPVLLVDDDPDLAPLLEKHLVRAGHAVVRCSTGIEAIARLRAGPSAWSAAIVDLVLPDVSGADLVASILALEPDLGIVVTSGSTFDPASLPAPAGNRVRFLHKPFRLAELTAALAAVCNRADPGPTSAAR